MINKVNMKLKRSVKCNSLEQKAYV